MGYLIGTDEAGYGPNLGPLVISATAWEAPDGIGGEDLFERLSHIIVQKNGREQGGLSQFLCQRKWDCPLLPDCWDGSSTAIPTNFPPIVMADSKALYSSGKGLRHLERGLWAALGLLDHRPQTWRDVWFALAPEALDPMKAIPWYADFDGPAPLDCDAAVVFPLIEALRAGLASAGVRFVGMRSRVIFAEEFNELVELHGSKGEALSRQTLALAARMIESLPLGPVSVICDKHGGRNRYAPLLSRQFPEWLVEVRDEGRQRSLYRFGPPDRRIEFCFRTKAESCLPAALASMASKYLRELAMLAFNDFWRARVDGLHPTAGYPQDAKRFRADIAETQRGLHIEDRILWRVK